MRINLLSLELINFRGAERVRVDFSPTATTISGANKTGKTTIFDAFTWLLFGKNSRDVKSFEIKTLNKDNEYIHELDHTVTGVLDENGVHSKFTRVYKEKWTRKRGSDIPIFDGHDTLYYYNDVPIKQSDYQDKVNNIVKEDLFKMLTNPYYFSNLPWEMRREVIFKLVPGLTDNDIAQGRQDFADLLSKATDLNLYKKELSAKHRKISTDLAEIPVRVSEVQKQQESLMLEPQDVISAALSRLASELTEIDASIKGGEAQAAESNKEYMDFNKQLIKTRSEIESWKHNAASDHRKREREIQSAVEEARMQLTLEQKKHDNLKAQYASERIALDGMKMTKTDLLLQWDSINAETMVLGEEDEKCPTCRQKLPVNIIENKHNEILMNFNRDKTKRLENVVQRGKQLAENIAAKEAKIIQMESSLTESQSEVDYCKKVLEESEMVAKNRPEFTFDASNEQYVALVNEESRLQGLIANVNIVSFDASEYVEKRKAIQKEIDVWRQAQTNRNTYDSLTKRIEELNEKSRMLSQQIADVERDMHTIEQFEFEKINLIESAVNSKFDENVRFRMYRNLINGGSEPCCDILIDGVPFPEANHAAQINAGISIINTFSDFYDVYCPIFIDNAEAVNYVLPSNSQMVKLVVTTDPQLVIS